MLVLELGAHVGGVCGSGWLMRLLLEICRLNREVVVVVGSGLCCGKVSEWLEGSWVQAAGRDADGVG